MAGERIGWEQIKQGYQMYQCPYYALFEATPSGRKGPGRLLFTYKAGDKDKEGLKLLQENLQVVEHSDPEALLYLQFYDRLGKNDVIDAGTPYSGSFPLRMREYSGYNTRAIAGLQPAQDNNFLQYLQTELHLAKDKILDLEDQVRELEDQVDAHSQDPAEKIDGILGTVGAAGNQFPWLADILKDWSTVLKHKFSASSYGRQPGALAGVGGAAAAEPDTDTSVPWNKRYEAARAVLMEWYAKEYGDLETVEGREKGCLQFASDMECLARLTKSPFKFKMALGELRSMK